MNDSQVKPNNYYQSSHYRKKALTPEKRKDPSLENSPLLNKSRKKDGFSTLFGCMGDSRLPTETFEFFENKNFQEKVSKQAIENLSNLPSETNSQYDNISVSQRRPIYNEERPRETSRLSQSFDKNLDELQNMTMKDVAFDKSKDQKTNFEKLLNNFENEMIKQDNTTNLDVIKNDKFQNKDQLMIEELKKKIDECDENFFETEQKRSDAITEFNTYCRLLDDIQNKDDQLINENMYKIAGILEKDMEKIIKNNQKVQDNKRKKIDELNKENREIYQWIKEIKDFEFQNDYAMKLNYEKYGRERMKDLAYDLVITRLREHDDQKFKNLKQIVLDKHEIYKKSRSECQEKQLKADEKLLKQEIMNLENEISKVQSQIKNISN